MTSLLIALFCLALLIAVCDRVVAMFEDPLGGGE